MSRKAPPDPKNLLIVTVHGTNDTADGPDGDKWFQRGSAFAAQLTESLARRGYNAAIAPHLWSGANTASGREHAARQLAKVVRKASKTFGHVHIVGHSHGGNVASEAATMIGWGLRRWRSPIASISTVGTPFFRVRLGSRLLMALFLVLCGISMVGLIAFSMLVLLLLPVLHLDPATYAADFVGMRVVFGESWTQAQLDAYVAQEMRQAKVLREPLVALIVPILMAVLVLILVLPVAARQMARANRLQRRQNTRAKIFSLWHPNDEAISFLRRVEQLEIEPFQRWAFWRSSRTMGLSVGVASVFLATALAAIISFVAVLALRIFDGNLDFVGRFFGFDADRFFGIAFDQMLGGVGETGLVIATIAGASLTPGLVFAGAYLLTRLVYGVLVEFFARRPLNRAVRSALQGMAFGRDGAAALDAVATHSHHYGVVPLQLSGNVEERMRLASDAASRALLEKYRWALFAAEPDKDALTRLSADAQTWKSLIHTTYFDQPEVVEALAGHIARSVDQQGTVGNAYGASR